MEVSKMNSIILATASMEYMNSEQYVKASKCVGGEKDDTVYCTKTAECCCFSNSSLDCSKSEKSSSDDSKKRKIQDDDEDSYEGELRYKIAPDDNEVYVIKTLMVLKNDGTLVNLKNKKEILFKRNVTLTEDFQTDFVYRPVNRDNIPVLDSPPYSPTSPTYSSSPKYYPPSPLSPCIPLSPAYSPTSPLYDRTTDTPYSLKSSSPPLSPLSGSFFFDFEI